MAYAGFHLKDNSLTVCKTILQRHPEIESFNLITHSVGVNWRQINKNREDKLRHLKSAFHHSTSSELKEYSRKEFLGLTLERFPVLKEHHVWSIISKVLCTDGEYRHIPMMNFHPEIGSLNEIEASIKHLTGDRPGVLLSSGRYFHYYGDFLLTQEEWLQFMASFLMPCVLVSPRYIGHRLHDGYCTLRLTADNIYKPLVPEVVRILPI